jgi:hypothetical protein
MPEAVCGYLWAYTTVLLTLCPVWLPFLPHVLILRVFLIKHQVPPQSVFLKIVYLGKINELGSK